MCLCLCARVREVMLRQERNVWPSLACATLCAIQIKQDALCACVGVHV
jgi:hypothetical protein